MPNPQVEIEFENPGNHDDCPWTLTVLGQREAQCLGAIDEDAAVQSRLIADDPMSFLVLSEQQGRKLR